MSQRVRVRELHGNDLLAGELVGRGSEAGDDLLSGARGDSARWLGWPRRAMRGQGGYQRRGGRDSMQRQHGLADGGGHRHGPSSPALAAYVQAPAVDVAAGERGAIGRAGAGGHQIGALGDREFGDAEAASAEHAQHGAGLCRAQRVVGPGGAGGPVH